MEDVDASSTGTEDRQHGPDRSFGLWSWALVQLVLYPLSTGPMVKLAAMGVLRGRALVTLDRAYKPFTILDQRVPGGHKVLKWYVNLWGVKTGHWSS